MLEFAKEKCVSYFNDKYCNEKIIVYGEGNETADLMLIGEAPGKQGNYFKKTFCRAGGEKLR